MKEKLQSQIKDLKLQIKKANEYIERSMNELKRLEDVLNDANNQKPKIVYKSDWTIELKKYKKYSDGYIEFETVDGSRGRYVELGASKSYTYPNNKMSVVLESHIGHVFEMYDCISHKYTEANLIDRIELLEGVVEYADGWVRKEEKE